MNTKERRFQVVELFGPTVQGEGIDQGAVAHFVRFGGCDFSCSWCDTPHAVVPSEIRKYATKMTATDILEGLLRFSPAPWVILTGGNPALIEGEDLVNALHEAGFLVAIETQGTVWKEWMRKVDRLCVSPKPPSSGMVYADGQLDRFMGQARLAQTWTMQHEDWKFHKVVIFNDEDLDYAEMIYRRYPGRLFLSAGNDAGRTIENPTREDTRSLTEVREDLLDQALWLTKEVFKRPALCSPDVQVQAQFHVGLWGNELGR